VYIVFVLIAILAALVFIIDFIPQFLTWQARIGIGKFQNTIEWKQRVAGISQKWLNQTPVIKLTDQNRIIVLDIIRGNYKRPAIQHWQEAALLLGIIELEKHSPSTTLKHKMDNFFSSKISNGNWKNLPTEVDAAILAFAILSYTNDIQKVKPAMDAVYLLILNLRGDDGTVAYRKRSMHLRYVDTIGFICPFLALYGKKYNCQEAIDLAIKQILEYNSYGMSVSSFLPCHTYDTQIKIGVGLYGWGRGLGWYAIGLIDTWKIIDDQHPSKDSLTSAVVAFTKTALQFQKPNGSWGWLVTQTTSRSDSSATATLAYFLSGAAVLDEVRGDALMGYKKAISYLQTITRRSGAVDFSQGDTKAIGVHSTDYNILPFTQGFTLRAIYSNKQE
jgi:unsaturated rhamnogalacturonyl hydrolase